MMLPIELRFDEEEEEEEEEEGEDTVVNDELRAADLDPEQDNSNDQTPQYHYFHMFLHINKVPLEIFCATSLKIVLDRYAHPQFRLVHIQSGNDAPFTLDRHTPPSVAWLSAGVSPTLIGADWETMKTARTKDCYSLERNAFTKLLNFLVKHPFLEYFASPLKKLSNFELLTRDNSIRIAMYVVYTLLWHIGVNFGEGVRQKRAYQSMAASVPHEDTSYMMKITKDMTDAVKKSLMGRYKAKYNAKKMLKKRVQKEKEERERDQAEKEEAERKRKIFKKNKLSKTRFEQFIWSSSAASMRGATTKRKSRPVSTNDDDRDPSNSKRRQEERELRI
jgi:hypothetical protein